MRAQGRAAPAPSPGIPGDCSGRGAFGRGLARFAGPWLGHLAATVDAAGDLYFMYITMPVGDVYRWRVAKVTAAGVLAWDKTLYSSTWGTIRRAHAPDDSVYLAWDHDNSLVSDWSLARIHVPSDKAQRSVNMKLPAPDFVAAGACPSR